MPTNELWYVSYGSNMSRARLACYIQGGRPRGASMTYGGARDGTMPYEDVAVELPGRLYFAGESRVWGGGTAFYDHAVPGPTPARAYRITAAQFVDIAAQEMQRVPDPDDPLEEVLLAGLVDGRHVAGPGHYETLIEVGCRAGLPMLTFTAPHGCGAVTHTPPTPAYLATIAEGLRDAHGWDRRRSATYFDAASAAADRQGQDPQTATVVLGRESAGGR